MKKNILPNHFTYKSDLKNLINIMTTCLLFLFIFTFHLMATNSNAQDAVVKLNSNSTTVSQLIKEIESQTDYLVVYSNREVDINRKVKFKNKSNKVSNYLNEAFSGTDIGYNFENDYIVLSKKALENSTVISETIKAIQQGRTITGKVTDEHGDPIIGATIVVKSNPTQGTVTDIDGTFSLLNAPDNAVLIVTYVGMRSQEVNTAGLSTINIVLETDVELLDEIIVVGYGTTQKVNLTGAVEQVTSEVFENRPITNISQGLVGVIPNLNISLTDGKPTQSPSFNVRGTTSIGQGGSALVLIDGVEGDPRMLNPNDIESISVLKDAASSSIYGARAAFGVVLITTKTASKGRTSVNYSSNFSSRRPTTTPDNITDSYPWAKGFSDAWSNWNDDGRTPTAVNKTLSFSPEYLAEIKRRWEDPSLPRIEINPTTGAYEYYYSTDWYDELYKDSFFAQDHNVSVSGGNDLASYYVSGRYNGEDGLYKYNTDTYSMYNLRARGNVQIFEWLAIDNNTEYSKMSYHQPINVGEGGNIWRNIADEGHPLAPLTNPDGTLTFPAAYTIGDRYLGKSGADLTQKIIKNKTALEADFLDKSLTLRADFTFQNTEYGHDQIRVQVPYSRYEGQIGYTGTNTNDFQERRSTTEYLATNVYANYIKSFNERHNFEFLAGFNYEQSTYNNITMTRNGIVYEDAKDINLALGNNITTSGGYNKWRVAGSFFRVNYNYMQRYLLEVNGRYDGSSRFPSNQQWAFFPSFSAAWRLTEEAFWEVDPNAISNIKFRISYGSLGNGSISPYTFTENFSISQSGRILGDTRPQRTAQPGVIPNTLTWETATTGNIGLDLNMLRNRLSFTGDLYRRWTKDMYTVGPSVPAVFGTGVPKGNYASLETTGWEISLNWMDKFNLDGKPFNYSARASVADSKAIITDYYNPDYLLTDYYIGQTIGEIWGYQVEGLFKSYDEIANSPSQSNIPAHNTRVNHPGDLKFKNLDGDDEIYHGLNRVGDSGDKTIIGNSSPRYVYGLTLGADWNNFFLTTFFQGVGKQQWYPSTESRFWGQYNRPYNQYPRWHESRMFREELQNFDAYLPLLSGYTASSSSRQLGMPNDRYLQNVAYVRLKTLNFGYNLPSSITSMLQANSISVYLSGENIWTWSPLYRLTKDTDVTNVWRAGSQLTGMNSDDTRGDGDGYNYPTLSTFSVGISINF
jgi:TonB-linked SusC/RagA family outer membrane protein